ncbi:hypothetical protein [Roseiarcus sp.]|uniref:hypothetical protein n=1 Tax=Roseiarcus sp. TaxID=1969460 RepID=UPI003F99AE9A
MGKMIGLLERGGCVRIQPSPADGRGSAGTAARRPSPCRRAVRSPSGAAQRGP